MSGCPDCAIVRRIRESRSVMGSTHRGYGERGSDQAAPRAGSSPADSHTLPPEFQMLTWQGTWVTVEIPYGH